MENSSLNILAMTSALRKMIISQGIDKTIEDIMKLYYELGYENLQLIIYIILTINEDKELRRKTLLLQQVILEKELKKEDKSE